MGNYRGNNENEQQTDTGNNIQKGNKRQGGGEEKREHDKPKTPRIIINETYQRTKQNTSGAYTTANGGHVTKRPAKQNGDTNGKGNQGREGTATRATRQRTR